MVPIPTPITSPLISISLGVANLVAVSAFPVTLPVIEPLTEIPVFVVDNLSEPL